MSRRSCIFALLVVALRRLAFAAVIPRSPVRRQGRRTFEETVSQQSKNSVTASPYSDPDEVARPTTHSSRVSVFGGGNTARFDVEDLTKSAAGVASGAEDDLAIRKLGDNPIEASRHAHKLLARQDSSLSLIGNGNFSAEPAVEGSPTATLHSGSRALEAQSILVGENLSAVPVSPSNNTSIVSPRESSRIAIFGDGNTGRFVVGDPTHAFQPAQSATAATELRNVTLGAEERSVGQNMRDGPITSFNTTSSFYSTTIGDAAEPAAVAMASFVGDPASDALSAAEKLQADDSASAAVVVPKSGRERKSESMGADSAVAPDNELILKNATGVLVGPESAVGTAAARSDNHSLSGNLSDGTISLLDTGTLSLGRRNSHVSIIGDGNTAKFVVAEPTTRIVAQSAVENSATPMMGIGSAPLGAQDLLASQNDSSSPEASSNNTSILVVRNVTPVTTFGGAITGRFIMGNASNTVESAQQAAASSEVGSVSREAEDERGLVASNLSSVVVDMTHNNSGPAALAVHEFGDVSKSEHIGAFSRVKAKLAHQHSSVTISGSGSWSTVDAPQKSAPTVASLNSTRRQIVLDPDGGAQGPESFASSPSADSKRHSLVKKESFG